MQGACIRYGQFPLPTQRLASDTVVGCHLDLGDILDFSKIEANSLELRPTALDLRHTLEAALQMVAADAERKGLCLAYCGLMPSLSSIAFSGDSLRIRQASPSTFSGNQQQKRYTADVDFQEKLNSGCLACRALWTGQLEIIFWSCGVPKCKSYGLREIS